MDDRRPDTVGPDVEARTAFATLVGARLPPHPGGRGRAPRRHRLDARPHAHRDDPAGRGPGPRGAEGARRRRRRRDDRRRRARPRRLLPLPPVQRDRPRAQPAARRHLAADVRRRAPGDAGRARRVRSAGPAATPHPRRGARRAARDRACGRGVRAARRAAHRGLAVRRRAGLPAVARHRPRDAVRQRARRRARSCRRSSPRCGGCGRASNRSSRATTSPTRRTTST